LKGKLPGKTKWYSREKPRGKNFSPYLVKDFGDQKPPEMRSYDPYWIIILFVIDLNAFRVEKLEKSALRSSFSGGTLFRQLGSETF